MPDVEACCSIFALFPTKQVNMVYGKVMCLFYITPTSKDDGDGIIRFCNERSLDERTLLLCETRLRIAGLGIGYTFIAAGGSDTIPIGSGRPRSKPNTWCASSLS